MAVFAVNFKCENCGSEWREEFDEREVVKRGSKWHDFEPNVSVYEEDEILNRLEHLRYIECPNCKSKAKVKIQEREPIGG